jgi:glycosyltransferase involved in cell wall biosynthesis
MAWSKDMRRKQSPRVAMLAHASYLTDPRVRREAEALAAMGVQVHVISLAEKCQSEPHRPEAVLNGVHIHRLPINKKRGNFLRYIYEYSMVGLLGSLKLAKLHLRGGLDVVHVHNMPDILVLAGVLPQLTGSKLVLDVHDPMPELYMSWNHRESSLTVRLLRLQETFSCWIADRVISVNETMRENLRAKGVDGEKIFIVHNFPDETLFRVCEIPEVWPQNPDRLVMLYCGTITENYDLGLAVKAMAKIAGQVPVRFKIMGHGNKLEEVLNLASALGVRDSIEVVGMVPIEKVAEEMRKADVGISCHRAGVFGDLYFSTKIIEYLSQGLAVLSPRTFTINRYLPADCLFYFEPGSVAALADAIRFVWQNPREVLKRMTQSSEVLARLTWQSEKERFCRFYTDLFNDATAQARIETVR